MEHRRKIKEKEVNLIIFLLEKLGLKIEEYPINEDVEEYEGGKMGSISMGNPDISPYLGDLIQANYIDSDGTPVVITLTQDSNNQLLDLDFWKVDFSKLITYPIPENLTFAE
ncbi:hypothetical protein EMA8858_01021 [Emticicia aquatica]|jgi:hypothetical protein|uniref:DUF6984 domain-containing protein n=1 Tax=Emticicia aquatica TaxID=1681835 RepID=A0ABN8ET88_9BACT|nr:hypothetical protein [Emticicia aquatica]CAH0994908.1 hypothetical protein EMA8858_01021 [Emticicia aquatica]